MDVKRTSVFGSLLEQNPLSGSVSSFVSIPGRYKSQPSLLKIDESILSKHIMLIGGTGCGKSNVFYHIISQIKKKMSSKDIMIIFDTKGDYYDMFAEKDDYVMANSASFVPDSVKWNLFREILADGWDDKSIELNAQEISWSIFREAIDKSKDPFFPNAARDLFASVLLCMMKTGKEKVEYKKECFYNSELKRSFDESTILEIKALLESHPEYASVISYIGDGTNGQALGVYAELLSTFRKLFSGVFAEKGSFSMRNFVREKGGKTLFLEYDLARGNILAPIYSLLFDLAIKEALGRNANDGNVYLICDEFRLLPYLQHIDDGVNFGRGLGVKVIAGLQSINQLTEAYSEYRGKNIIAGFSTVFAFRANDAYTRDYITNLHGKNIVMEQYKTITNSVHEEKRNANVVEDWDVNELNIGEAIIGFPFDRPFRFQFDLFLKK